jgi:hypothetical protein
VDRLGLVVQVLVTMLRQATEVLVDLVAQMRDLVVQVVMVVH